ncbi:MAG: hypothetical protein MUP85_03620 [Candidatus Lokiarchaeota archaeon]|nr:hypothetical protein [Candidatus Lokiarchaeota archaeon]
MKHIYFLLLISFVLISCLRQNDSKSIQTLTKGKFVLDSLNYQIKLGSANNDAPKNYIDAKLIYHFENYRGNLNTVIFTINNSSGIVCNIDYAGPDSVNKMLTLNNTIWLKERLNIGDSTKVECKMSGAFSKVSNGSIEFVDTFSLYKKDIIYY